MDVSRTPGTVHEETQILDDVGSTILVREGPGASLLRMTQMHRPTAQRAWRREHHPGVVNGRHANVEERDCLARPSTRPMGLVLSTSRLVEPKIQMTRAVNERAGIFVASGVEL